ncbi:MAG: transcriptional repressor [Clostridia bacterium]|nr:transcriptional repressor [Clostridia bacterium]
MVKRNTRQKRIIMDAVCSLDHPSATAVYERVQAIDPKISRSTVFRVLSDEAAAGKLLRLHINGTDDRFDPTLTSHCHIRCRVCGKVEDIMTDIATDMSSDIEGSHGYSVEYCDVVFYGICPDCKDKTNSVQTA